MGAVHHRSLNALLFGISAENYLDGMLSSVECGNNVTVNGLAVDCHRFDARAYVVRVGYADVVCRAAELTGNLEAVPFVRNGRIDLQTVVLRFNAEDILRDRNEIPCRRTSKP